MHGHRSPSPALRCRGGRRAPADYSNRRSAPDRAVAGCGQRARPGRRALPARTTGRTSFSAGTRSRADPIDCRDRGSAAMSGSHGRARSATSQADQLESAAAFPLAWRRSRYDLAYPRKRIPPGFLFSAVFRQRRFFTDARKKRLRAPVRPPGRTKLRNIRHPLIDVMTPRFIAKKILRTG